VFVADGAADIAAVGAVAVVDAAVVDVEGIMDAAKYSDSSNQTDPTTVADHFPSQNHVLPFHHLSPLVQKLRSVSESPVPAHLRASAHCHPTFPGPLIMDESAYRCPPLVIQHEEEPVIQRLNC